MIVVKSFSFALQNNFFELEFSKIVENIHNQKLCFVCFRNAK